MDYYIDITIYPNSEFPASVLMNAIYSRFHHALCELHSTSIAASFPQYGSTLGNILRVHGEKATLERFFGLSWLIGMDSYCSVGPITSILVRTKFRTISRAQRTVSQSKLRRLIKRHSLTEEEVTQYHGKIVSNCLVFPYVDLLSKSTGQRYRRYIKLGELLEQPVAGQFDQFGLSVEATVPWFD